MDLIRRILLELESCEYSLYSHKIEIEGYTPREVSYHLQLMSDAGLLTVERANTYGGADFNELEAKHITWAGQEFLASIRDPSFFSKVEDYLVKNSIPLSIEAVKMAVPLVIKGIIGAQ